LKGLRVKENSIGWVGELKLRAKLRMVSSLSVLRQRLIGPYAMAVLVESKNGLLLVPSGDMYVGRNLCFHGRYDHKVLEVLLGELNVNSRVLVVGAHVGSLAVPLAKRVRSVVAVEANPDTFVLLRMNVMLNDLTNVDLYNLAAGDSNLEVSMLANRVNTGGSKLQMGDWNSWIYTYDKPKTIRVQMRRLDDVLPAAAFDLILMDIEGSEARALRGMAELLKRSGALMVEVVGHHLRQIAKVTDEEFLSLITPYFDEAEVLWGGSHELSSASLARYQRKHFGEMVRECCRRGSANVLFRKTSGVRGGA
jgi:FkbM family methyltransferase